MGVLLPEINNHLHNLFVCLVPSRRLHTMTADGSLPLDVDCQQSMRENTQFPIGQEIMDTITDRMRDLMFLDRNVVAGSTKDVDPETRLTWLHLFNQK